jgi:hypothetical protein
MSIELLTPRAIEVNIYDHLDKGDDCRLSPVIGWAIREHSRIALVVNLRDASASAPERLWQELGLDVRHYDNVDRLAIVGSGRGPSHQWMADVSRRFLTSDVQYFPAHDLDRARTWATVHADAVATIAARSG